MGQGPANWVEPVKFRVEAVAQRGACRSGIKPGDTWHFEWNTPEGFCPKTLLLVFPLMIACECAGDLRERGGKSHDEIEFDCPDGEIRFRLSATRVVPAIGSTDTQRAKA